MKIVTGRKVSYRLELHDSRPGDVVQFEHIFHQKHDAEAYFLVLKVPGEYIAYGKRLEHGNYKVMVANLDNGNASLVRADRMVRKVRAEVHINE